VHGGCVRVLFAVGLRALGLLRTRGEAVYTPFCAPLLLALACSGPRSDDAPLPSPFRKVTLDAQPGEPMALAVLPDGRVLHTTRRGVIWLHELDGEKHVAAELAVYNHDEEGLQGIAISPDFASDGWIYVYYSPPLATVIDDPTTLGVDEGAAPVPGTSASWAAFAGVMRLSRFQFDGSALELGSEQVLLEVPVDRGICCHVGGKIDFDGLGNLYLSTGDDTNPFMSDGYTPIDERPDQHPAFDAQRSAGNSNDLRGKLLRFHVEADGTLRFPEGNLFAPGTDKTRPEIYAMGLRNPFRFSVNRQTGDVYLADYSPDALTDNPERGPAGTGKWVSIRQAGNYGWPYCVGTKPYVDFDFATRQSSGAFDCNQPKNESPHNTGLVDLPPVVEPQLAYSYGPSALFPALGAGGVAPMAGPVYVYDDANPSSVKWPAKYSGAVLFYEWSRDYVALFVLSESGAIESIERLPISADNPMDLQFGPDGALYMLEYGDGYYNENQEAQLSRIEYVGPASGTP
jgi:cytochrome c